MPATARNDPYRSFNFVVEIEGVPSAGFASVSGLAGELQVVEYREGADPLSSSRKLPGRVAYPNVVLRRGVTASRDLWDWFQTGVEGQVERRDVAIVLLDNSRQPVLRWLLRNAWVTKFEAPELDASANEVAIETIELVHERLELD